MKKTILVLLVGILALGLGGKAFAANLLGNSGFESGALEPWAESGHPETEIATEQRQAGTYSAARYVDEFDPDEAQPYWSAILQEKTVTPGQPVYGRIYIKTRLHPLATARAGLVLSFMDASGDTIPGADVTSIRKIGGMQSSWRLVELCAPVAPAGAASVSFNAYLYAENGDTLSQEGKAYFDSAYMDNVNRVINVVNSGIINPGFENGSNDWLVPLYNGVPGIPFTATDAVKRAGLYSAKCKVVTLTPPRDFYATVYEDVTCTAGKQVTAYVYVQTEFLSTSKSAAGLQIQFIGANNQIIKTYNKNVRAAATWTLVKPAAAVIAPTGTQKIRYSLYVYNPVSGSGSSVGKSAYFDTAVLSITTPPATP